MVGQEVYDGVHAFIFECGAYEYFRIWIQTKNISSEAVHIEVGVRKQIDLVDHHVVCSLEQFWVFSRFVISFGHAGYSDAVVFTEREGSSTYQVSDIVHDQCFYTVQVQFFDSAFYHIGF